MLGIGYNAASELIDLLEKKGVVGPQQGGEQRQIIAERLQSELAAAKRMTLVERLQKCTEELQAISREIDDEDVKAKIVSSYGADATFCGDKSYSGRVRE